MSKFEFLMMIASVVVAVGLAEVIAGWRRLLQSTIDHPAHSPWALLGIPILVPLIAFRRATLHVAVFAAFALSMFAKMFEDVTPLDDGFRIEQRLKSD